MATTLYVYASDTAAQDAGKAPGEYYTSIQEAVKNAGDGDTIQIAAGIYNDDVVFSTLNGIAGDTAKELTIKGDKGVYCTGTFQVGSYKYGDNSACAEWNKKVTIDGIEFDPADNGNSLEFQYATGGVVIQNCDFSAKADTDDYHVNKGTQWIAKNICFNDCDFEGGRLAPQANIDETTGIGMKFSGCSFQDVKINIATGYKYEFEKTSFTYTFAQDGLTYAIRTNSDQAIDIADCTFNIDVKDGFVPIKGDFGILWAREAGAASWNIKNSNVNYTEKALELAKTDDNFAFVWNASTDAQKAKERINIENLSSDDAENLETILQSSTGIVNVKDDENGTYKIYDDGEVSSNCNTSVFHLNNAWTSSSTLPADLIYGINAFSTIAEITKPDANFAETTPSTATEIVFYDGEYELTTGNHYFYSEAETVTFSVAENNQGNVTFVGEGSLILTSAYETTTGEDDKLSVIKADVKKPTFQINEDLTLNFQGGILQVGQGRDEGETHSTGAAHVNIDGTVIGHVELANYSTMTVGEDGKLLNTTSTESVLRSNSYLLVDGSEFIIQEGNDQLAQTSMDLQGGALDLNSTIATINTLKLSTRASDLLPQTAASVKATTSTLTTGNIYAEDSAAKIEVVYGSILTVNETLENAGEIFVENSTVTAGNIENRGTFTVSGESGIDATIENNGLINITEIKNAKIEKAITGNGTIAINGGSEFTTADNITAGLVYVGYVPGVGTEDIKSTLTVAEDTTLKVTSGEATINIRPESELNVEGTVETTNLLANGTVNVSGTLQLSLAGSYGITVKTGAEKDFIVSGAVGITEYVDNYSEYKAMQIVNDSVFTLTGTEAKADFVIDAEDVTTIIDINAGGIVINDGAAMEAEIINNAGSITIDATAGSKLTATEINGTGTITIDATNFEGFAYVLDLSAASMENDERLIIQKAETDTNISVIYGDDGDVYLTNADLTVLYASTEYTGEYGDKVAEGKFYGINAFGSGDDAVQFAMNNENIKEINADSTDIGVGFISNITKITTNNAEGLLVNLGDNGITFDTHGEQVELETGDVNTADASYLYGVSVGSGVTVNADLLFGTNDVNIEGTLNVNAVSNMSNFTTEITGTLHVADLYLVNGLNAVLNVNKGADFSTDKIIVGERANGNQFNFSEQITFNKFQCNVADAVFAVTENTVFDLKNKETLISDGIVSNKGTLNVLDVTEFNAANVTNDNIINVDGTTFAAVTVTNNGTFNVSGESTLNIGTLTGNAIDFMDGAIIKDSVVGGYVDVLGKVTFRGDNTFVTIKDFEAAYLENNEAVNSSDVTIEAGASVTLTKYKYGFGFGDKVTINGELEDAKEAFAAGTLKDEDLSLDAQGGINAAGYRAEDVSTFTINDAYVRIGSKDQSFRSSRLKDDSKLEKHNGTFNFNWNNAVVETGGILEIHDSGASTGKFNFTLVDSVFKIGSVYEKKGIVHNVGQFMFSDKDSTFTATNSQVISIGDEAKQLNSGTLSFTDSTLDFAGTFVNDGSVTFTGSEAEFNGTTVINDGSITVDGATFNAENILNAEAEFTIPDLYEPRKKIKVVTFDAQGNEIGSNIVELNGTATVPWLPCPENGSYKCYYEDGTELTKFTVGEITTHNTSNIFNVKNGQIDVKQFVNNGTISVDWNSSLKISNLTGAGTITIDATGFSGGAKTLVDVDSTTFNGNIDVTGNDSAYVVRGTDGDIVLTDAARDVIYFDYTWADADPETDGKQSYQFGADLGDGKYYGINAFDKFDTSGVDTSKGWSNLLVLPEDAKEIVLTAGNGDAASYGMLRPTQSITVKTAGEGYAVIDRFVNVIGDLTIDKDAKLRVLAVNGLSGANNQGTESGERSKITIDGELYFANATSGNKALYLWGSSTKAGYILINKGGKLIADAGNVENHGTIEVKGTMELGRAGDAPKLAGVGNYSGHLIVDGAEGEGKLVVKHNQINFGGGNTSAPWQDAAEGCTVTIKNGGIIETAAVTFRNGKNSTVTLDNGNLLFTKYEDIDYSGVTPRYFDNQGIINVTNGTLDMSDRNFDNTGSLTIAGSSFTVGKLTGTRLHDDDSALFNIKAAYDADGNAIATELNISNGFEQVIDVNRNSAAGDKVILTGNVKASSTANSVIRTYGDVELSGFKENSDDKAAVGKLFTNGNIVIKDNTEVNINWLSIQGNGTIEGGSTVNAANVNIFDHSTLGAVLFTVNGTLNADTLIITNSIYKEYYDTNVYEGDSNFVVGENGVIERATSDAAGRFDLQLGQMTVYGYVNQKWDATGGTGYIGNDGYSTTLTVDGTYAAADNNKGKFINSGTQKLEILEGSFLNVVNGGTFSWANSVKNDGAISIEGNFTAGTVTNNGTVKVSGESTINGGIEGEVVKAAAFSGDGWINMDSVTLDAETDIKGGKVRFVNGESTLAGATVNADAFQVGFGAFQATDERETVADIIVNVTDNSYIHAEDVDYYGWVGTGWFDRDEDKAAAMTDARYTLNISNSVAEFGYFHVSTDGILNVTGNADTKKTYTGVDYSYYTGRTMINGVATFDNVDVLAQFTNVSCDNGTEKGGKLIIKNGANYVSWVDSSSTGSTFQISKTGVVEVDNATLDARHNTLIAEDASLIVKNGGTVTANRGAFSSITNNGTISVTDSTLDAYTLTNNGTVEVSGESTLNIGTLTGAMNIKNAVLLDGTAIGGDGGYESTNYVDFTGDAVEIQGTVSISPRIDTYTDVTVAAGAVFNGDWICMRDAAKTFTVEDTATLNCGTFWSSVSNPAYANISGTLDAEDKVYLHNGDVYGKLVVGKQLITYSNDALNIHGEVEIECTTAQTGWLIGNVNSSTGAYAGDITVKVMGGSVYVAGNDFGNEINIADNGILEITSKNAEGNTIKGSVTVGKGIVNNMGELKIDGGTLVVNYKIENTGSMNWKDANVTVTYGNGWGAINNNGTITVDANSLITAGSITGEGSITIDATDFTGTKKVIDLAGTSSLEGKVTIEGEGITAIYGEDGDVTITDASTDTLYVNAAWAGSNVGDVVGAGYIYGFNAASSMSEVANMIKTDGSDTTIKFESDIEDGSVVFNYGAGDITFTADKAVTIKQNTVADWDFAVGDVDSTITIGENVTFQINENASGLYVYYGAGLKVEGTVTGGANWGCAYLAYGNHSVEATGTLSVGRVHLAWTTLTVNGDAASDRTDAHVDSNYLLVEESTFTANNAIIDVGAVHDSNNGGLRYGASKFNIKDSVFAANSVTLKHADSKFNVTGASTLNIGTLTGAVTVEAAELTKSSVNKGTVNFKGENTFEGDFNATYAYVGDWNNEKYDGSVDFGTKSNVNVGGQMIIGYDTLVPGANNVVFGDTTGAVTTDKVFKAADVSVRRDGTLFIANTTGENKINTMNVMGSLILDNAKLTGEVQIGGTGNGEVTVRNGAEYVLGGSSNSVVVLGKSTKGTLNVDKATVTVKRCGPGASYKVPADTFVIGYNGGVGILNVNNGGSFEAVDYNGDKDGGKMNVQLGTGSEINVSGNGSVEIAGNVANAGSVVVENGKVTAGNMDLLSNFTLSGLTAGDARTITVAFMPEGATEGGFSKEIEVGKSATSVNANFTDIADGKYDLTVMDGTIAFTATTEIVNGTLNINGGSLTLDTLSLNKGEANVSGSSELNGKFTAGKVNFADGTVLTSTTGAVFDDNYTVGDMTFGTGEFEFNGLYISEVELTGSANVTVKGTFGMWDNEKLTVGADAELIANSIYFNGGSMEIAGTVSSLAGGNDGGFILNGKDDVVTVKAGGNLNVTYVDAYKDSASTTVDVYGTATVGFKLSDGIGKFTWNLYAGTSLTVNKYGIVMNSSDSAINLTDADLTVTELSGKGSIAMDVNSTITFADMTVNSGTITIDMSDINNAKGNTLFNYTGSDTAAWDLDAYKAILGNSSSEIDNFLIVEDGDLIVKSNAVVYVNSEYTTDPSKNQYKTFEEAIASGAGRIITEDDTISSAVGYKGVEGIIEDGTYNGTISGGAITESEWDVWEEATGDTNLTIEGGEFNKHVIGAERVEKGASYRDGDSNLTIKGGTFNMMVVGGMAYVGDGGDVKDQAALIGDVNLTIEGGTFNNWIYGGSLSKVGYSTRTTIEGDITVKVNASENVIDFNEDKGITLVAGSYQHGLVEGSTQVIFTGKGEKLDGLNEADTIWGGSSADVYMTDANGNREFDTMVTGDRTFTFDNFTGDFDALIRGFETLEVLNGSVVNVTNANLDDIKVWNFDTESTFTGSLGDLVGDTLNVDITDWDQKTPVDLISGDLFSGAPVEGMTVTLGGQTAEWNTAISGYASTNYKLAYNYNAETGTGYMQFSNKLA